MVSKCPSTPHVQMQTISSGIVSITNTWNLVGAAFGESTFVTIRISLSRKHRRSPYLVGLTQVLARSQATQLTSFLSTATIAMTS